MLRLLVAFVVVLNVMFAVWALGDRPGTDSGRSVPEVGDIVLIQEVDPRELTPRSLLQLEVAPSRVAETGLDSGVEPDLPELCQVLSYFPTRDSAESLAGRFLALDMAVRVEEQTTERPTGTIMVYIEPLLSAQSAQREFRVLQASGVDSFIIADGELQNGISLGVFQTEENAQVQQARIERLGYSAKTRQVMVEERRYSLVVGGAVLDALPDEYWSNIANENSDISVEQKECIEVASTVNFQ